MVMPERIIPEVIIRPGGWWWPREQEEKQPERIYPIPSDGLIEIPLDVPSDVTRVDIAVTIIVCFDFMRLPRCIRVHLYKKCLCFSVESNSRVDCS